MLNKRWTIVDVAILAIGGESVCLVEQLMQIVSLLRTRVEPLGGKVAHQQ